MTTITLAFKPLHGGVTIGNQGQWLIFEPGDYIFSAHFNYPQLQQVDGNEIVKEKYKDIIRQSPDDISDLSFLSYSNKLLAGSWRFLTYFGRDDLITTILLEPILSRNVTKFVIGSVLERVDRGDGSACHEEVIGDYATYINLKEGNPPDRFICDYKMIDTHFFLPILLERHFVQSMGGVEEELNALLSTAAGQDDPLNRGLKWGDLLFRLTSKIMNQTEAFAAPGGQTRENLIRLQAVTGQWRDSVHGLGGARIPFDVNTALVPAALRSIASLCQHFKSVYGDHTEQWATLAATRAQIWEEHTLPFFEVKLSASQATQSLTHFVDTNYFYKGPSHAEWIGTEGATYYAVGLEGNDGLDQVPVIHSDTLFRILFLDESNNQLAEFLNNTALSVIRPFPAGLMTPVGMVVANPSLSNNEYLIDTFSNSAYHGTVVWSWQLVAMAKGLERQLDRCSSPDVAETPAFCHDASVYRNVKVAYNVLWDAMETNKDILAHEVWSWIYKDGNFKRSPLESIPPPPGSEGMSESDIIQLWSLTFLAVKRNEDHR